MMVTTENQNEISKDFKALMQSWPHYNKAHDTLIPRMLKDEKSILPFIRSQLNDPDAKVRECAVYLLCQMKEPDLEILLPFVDDENGLIRTYIFKHLSKRGDSAIDTLGRYVKHPNESVRREVVNALHDIGEPALDLLTQFTDDTSVYVKHGVISALFKIGNPGISVLIPFLEDNDGQIVAEVLDVINHTGAETAPQLLSEQIFEELIIRKSDRPKEFFNPDVVAEAFTGIIRRSPSLQTPVYSELCRLAYLPDKLIRERAISVARELDASKFAALVKSCSEEDPSTAAEIMQILGGAESSSFFAGSQSQHIERFRKPLTELEDISLKRWHELTTQAKWGFWLSLSMSVGWFIVGIVIIWYGIQLLVSSSNIPQQISGGLLAAITAGITAFSGRFWKDPVVHIQKFSAQQARLQASFIGYMNRVAQIRLVFESSYEKGEGIVNEELQQYQDMLKDANNQAAQELWFQEKADSLPPNRTE